MDWAEKDEIVDQVLIRMSELSDNDRKTRAIMNRKVMRDASREQSKRIRELSNGLRQRYGNRGDVEYPHLWHAIYEINKLVPWIIGVRYSSDINEDAFYKAHPNAERRTHCISVVNQMLIEDKKLAEQIARELVDILFKYIEPDAWDENC